MGIPGGDGLDKKYMQSISEMSKSTDPLRLIMIDTRSKSCITRSRVFY